MLPKIERYEIDREIGHGGMATVYRGRDVRLDRWVAIKVMHPHLRGAKEARARFAREARAVAKLHHPSVLEIYDYSGEGSDDAYIATELLTGPTLRGFAESRPELPVEVVACIGVELAEALSAAHAQGIVHRDVKPENVLLHEKRCVKLTDFGIAGMLDPSASAMTATGQILGSPAHMSPEQITDGSADARSDVFSLGTILYWLATGRLPFDGKNAHQVLKRVVDDDPVPPIRLRPGIGRELDQILLRCLEKQANARFQSAQDLARALTAWLTQLGIDDPRATLASYLSDPEATTGTLRESSLAALLERAAREVSARDRFAAADSLERVLALDEQNAEAQALLDKLDAASRRRERLGWAAAALALLALVGGGAGYWASRDAEDGGAATPALVEVTEPPSAGPETPEETPAPAPVTTDTDTEGEAPANVAPGPQPAEETPTRPPAEPTETPRARPAPAPRPARSKEPRKVVFKPYPVNVAIAVDGGPLRPLGPDFQSVELPPGDHSFRFVGGRECCEDQTLEVEVPPGPGTTVLEPRLAFRPARLYVASNVPANVEVGEGLAAGRTRSVITVPVTRSLIEAQRISVTAPGYQPYTTNVSLRAGKVREVRVTLETDGAAQP